MKPRLETLTLLHHIQQHHQVPAAAQEVAASTGMHPVTLRTRMKKLAAAGYLETGQRTDWLPHCGSHVVVTYQPSQLCRALLEANQHRVHEYRVLQAKPRQQIQYKMVNSVFNLANSYQ